MAGFSLRVPEAEIRPSILVKQKDNEEEEKDKGEDNTGNTRSTGWGRRILQDFKTTIGTHWREEMTNFNTKTIAVSLFLFIAVIAPCITFGAVYAKTTNNAIGTSELLLSTAWCGIFYSLFSGMPLMINGATGPVLAFQAVLASLSEKTIGVPFLTFNAWVGLWVAFYMVIAAFIDLNRFIKYATRFTDEIFAFLIVSIYILDAVGNPSSKVGLLYYFDREHPHNLAQEDLDPNYDYMTVALLALILGFGTAFFAIGLRSIRFSSFCCNGYIRSVITDFAITISVVLFTTLQHTIFSNVRTEELNVPDSFAPTFNCCTEACTSYFPDDCPNVVEAFGRRPWLVNLFDLNGKTWVIFMSAGPAALAFILCFLDNGITWHIINHPSNKITHGDAYNYDTLISAIMIAVNSILGLPWLVASTVPCILHITAMSERTKEGVTTSVQESRLTGFLTHVLVLGTCFALNVIKLIPLPILYGVFLFMGLVALPAQQLWQRILLFFQEPAMVGMTPYTKYVKPLGRVHLFTAIELLFFAMLYVVKSFKMIAIAFPIMILLCIPVRIYLLPKIFSEDELILLDGSPEAIERWILTTTKGIDDNTEEIRVMTDANGELKRLVQIEGNTYPHETRSRQLSMDSANDFFAGQAAEDGKGGRQRQRRTRQVSSQSIESFMLRDGLTVPEEPIGVEDEDGSDDATDKITRDSGSSKDK